MRQFLLSAVMLSFALLAGCQEKSALGKAEDKVNDALDSRPAEQIRDAAEDMSAAAKDFGSAVKDVAKDVAHDTKDVASDVARDAKDTARDLGDSAKKAVNED
jgi:methyl-accepting chemotaxis protein